MASCFSLGERSDKLEIGLCGCFEETRVHQFKLYSLDSSVPEVFPGKNLERGHSSTHNVMMNSGFVSPINSLSFKNMQTAYSN